jgi:hypothetical protein
MYRSTTSVPSCRREFERPSTPRFGAVKSNSRGETAGLNIGYKLVNMCYTAGYRSERLAMAQLTFWPSKDDPGLSPAITGFLSFLIISRVTATSSSNCAHTMTTTPEKTAEDLQASSGRPSAPLRTETFRKSRPELVGPDIVEPPFPIFLSGAVQRGFGRGGKDLGCPTGEFGRLSRSDFTPQLLPLWQRTFPMNRLFR